MDNKPRRRETRVGSGKPGGGVFRRGSDLGTGPVGSGKVPGSGSGSSGSGGTGRQQGGGSGQGGGNRGLFGGGMPGRGGCGGGIAVVIVVIILIVVFAGKGCAGCGTSTALLSGLTGGNSEYDSYYDYYDSMESGSYGSQSADSSYDYGDISSLFGGAASAESWTEEENTETLDTSVATGSRNKYTKIKGGGNDTVTVMVYMCGTDLESKSGMATSDLVEMTKADLSGNVNLLIYTGGCTQWRNSVISNSRNQIFRVVNGGLVCVRDDAGNGAMTDHRTLADYISWAKTNYPADRYDLIFWDHGNGSVSGYGYDQKYPNSGSMTLAGINKALASTDIKFDFIGFDACLMATAETALMLDKYADYMIASEETEPGIGWYYTDWLNTLSANTSIDTPTLGKKIIDDFVSNCARYTRGQKATLSIVDIAELANTVPDKLAAFANDITEDIKNDQYKTVANARTNTKEFAASNRLDQIDLVHFAKNMGNASGEALAEAVMNAVKYNSVSSNITNAYGLSIYFPYSRSNYVDSMVNTYDEIGMSDEYGRCIKNFAALSVSGQVAAGGTSSSLSSLLGSLTSGFGTSSSSYYGSGSSESYAGSMSSGDLSSLLSAFIGGDSGIVAGFDRSNTAFMTDNDLGQDYIIKYLQNNAFDDSQLVWQQASDGTKYIDISQDQWGMISNIDMHMYFNDGEGFIDLGLDNIYEIDENGRLLNISDGTWIAINGQAVSYNHIDTVEDGDNYTITGFVPALLNGDRVKLILVFDNENPYGYIAGATYDYDSEITDVVAKSLTELVPGDTLDFICDYYTYEGEYNGSYLLGEQMEVTESMIIENVYIGDNTRRAFLVTDIYGQDHWSESF